MQTVKIRKVSGDIIEAEITSDNNSITVMLTLESARMLALTLDLLTTSYNGSQHELVLPEPPKGNYKLAKGILSDNPTA